MITVKATKYDNLPHLSVEAESASDLILGKGWDYRSKNRIDRAMQDTKGYAGEWYDRGTSGMRAGEIVNKILAGDDLFFNNIKSKLDLLTPPQNKPAVVRQMKRKRKRVKADHGNDLNIHDVMQGRIDRAWTGMRFEEKETHANKNVHLIINSSLNGNISAESAEWRAAAAIAIYQELVKMNKSVAIYMVRTSSCCFEGQSSGHVNTFMLPVKKLGQMMSIQHVAAYCSASFTRAVMMYRFSNLVEGKTPTMGYGFALNKKILPHSLKTLAERGQNVIFVPHCFSKMEAEATIESVVNQTRRQK